MCRLGIAAALSFSPFALAQTCPIPPPLPACLALAVGEVSVQTLQPGQVLCVEPGAAQQEFTVVPANYAPAADVIPTFLAADVVAVTGPPTPRPLAPGKALASLAVPDAGVDADAVQPGAALRDEAAELLATRPREELLVRPDRRGKVLPSTLQVDDVFDIQVAPGCSGALDLRKARVEAVSPVGATRRLYIAQEVIDDEGTWVPAVPGGFTRADFESIRAAYEEPFTDPAPTYPIVGGGSPTSIGASGARDVLVNNFGQLTDVDGNGGTVVFFTRRLNEAVPPASSGVIFSRFEARDFFSSAPGSCPRSNEGEIIYMAVPDPTGLVNSNVRTVSFIVGNVVRAMAHQMTRLTNAGRRIYETGAALEEPWLDETLGWMSSELLFYRTSVGLVPRGNINLTALTTGPNASRRVAAFNGYANQAFTALRMYYLATASGWYPGRFNVLHPNPPNAPAFETENERISYYYGVAAMFLRYALDRRNGDDSVALRALVESDETGLANLESLFGADMRDWMRDFAAAMYADDNAFAVTAPYRTASWNYRSVYGGLGGFPLSAAQLTDGVPYTPTYLHRNGGIRWLRFGVDAGTPGVDPTATFEYSVGPGAPITPLRVAVVRTK
ncbi:hypothetical protein [Chiayiivirga flava]|uniref:Uncharacterized protein n=1 Tax=Chiayiivirga flava TaxID=659595 RepID=A0A7W8D691_9GAMM|nr:hypothetical protein [Chiayiivirga flava]MBB5208678.1 hypothetical protein [Chiayiivirga flava]